MKPCDPKPKDCVWVSSRNLLGIVVEINEEEGCPIMVRVWRDVDDYCCDELEIMTGNERLPKETTYGERYHPAMEIRTEEEAALYFRILVENTVQYSEMSYEEAVRCEKSNLGYYAGYYDYETMERVNRLFGTTHPVFGSVAPTAKQAFEKGLELGSRHSKQDKLE